MLQVFIKISFSQTNPQPFDLQTGNYLLTQWPANSTSGTYPANMIFHYFNLLDADSNITAAADWVCPYNLTSRARIMGKDTNGFSFVNTTSAQYDNCLSGSSTSKIYAGEAVLALSTLNQDSINL